MTAEHGTIVRWNGTQWAQEATPTTELISNIWGFVDWNVWAVGTGGVLLHRTFVP
jgi:hypothetical protein